MSGYYLKSKKSFKDDIGCQRCVYCSQVGALGCINVFDKNNNKKNESAMCPGQPSCCNWWFWWNGDALVRWSGLRPTSREEYKDQQNKCKYQIQIQGPKQITNTNTRTNTPIQRKGRQKNVWATSWAHHGIKGHIVKSMLLKPHQYIGVWLLLVETDLKFRAFSTRSS